MNPHPVNRQEYQVHERILFNPDLHMLLGVVLMAALPSAQNTFLFASKYRCGVAVARETILLSTAAAARR